ncbi:uncharacterized protein [Atheta coriaria]|uniref:uncharacterized protein n=1 Tax=Dalotia coriaria TaxID=877792 RepID=UPI0031F3612C
MEIAYRNYANVQNQPSLFFNYNLEGEFLRPFGDACINMVFLTNVSDFNRFYDIAYNVKSTDVILIILYMPAYTNDREYDTSRAVLIYQKWNNFVKVIHYHSEKEFSIIDVTTELSDFETYENSFQVFKTIDIAYKTCSPFIFEENQNQLNGIEYKILEVVMDKLNFTFQLVNYSNTPVRLILEDLNDRKVNMVVGCLSNTISRNQLVSFTPDFFYEHYSVIYSSRGYKHNSTVSILPLRSVLDQPMNLKSKHLSVRLIMASWLLTALIFSNAYKSKLSSSMIEPNLKEPDSIVDLLRFDYSFYLNNIDRVFLSEIMTMSFNATFQKLVQRHHDFDEICECFPNISHNHYGLIGEETVLKYSLYFSCVGNLTIDENAAIRKTAEPVFKNGHAWAFKRNSPFIRQIDYYLELLKSFGIIQKWYSSPNNLKEITRSNSPIDRQTQEEPLSRSMVLAPFLVLGFGSALAFCVFIVEIVLYYRKKTGNRKI